jgi:hypothetical protein
MYLRVVSSSLQPEEISRRLGVNPDESSSIGSRRRPETPPRATSTWTRFVSAPGVDMRPEDLEQVVLGWGRGFATALGQLVDNGDVEAMLEIVQEIRDLDSGRDKGIFLGADLVAWLSIAKASLDIDQYIYHECGEESTDVVIE